MKLAIAIARRVLHRELATDPEAILGLVMAAFQKLNARETHRLRVSPPGRRRCSSSIARRLELPPALEIVADASLGAGQRDLRNLARRLDASVDTQLAEIERGFADVMRRRARRMMLRGLRGGACRHRNAAVGRGTCASWSDCWSLPTVPPPRSAISARFVRSGRAHGARPGGRVSATGGCC